MIDKDKFGWLDLPNIPDEIYNPFLDDHYGVMHDPIEEFMCFTLDIQYLHFVCKEILNIELLPFQLAILDRLWNKRLPMLIASRGAGKSFIIGVYSLLRLLLSPGIKVVLVGSSFRQSKQIHDYIVSIWDRAPILRDIAGKNSGPKKSVDRYEFFIGTSVATALPIGDGCLSSNTLMTYENKIGYISEDIPEGTTVDESVFVRDRNIYGNFGFNNSDEAYYNGIRPTKIITTELGFSYEGTHNHKMKVLRDGEIKFIRSDEMVVGETILIDKSDRWHNESLSRSDTLYYNLGLESNDIFLKEMLSANKEQMSDYLRGFFEQHLSSGLVFSNINYFSLKCNNEESIKIIQNVLLHYSIISERTNNKLIIKDKSSLFNLIDKICVHLDRFKNIFSLDTNTDNIYYDKISSIEDGECATYDVHVPSGHEYTANGFFSHNSKIRGIRANIIISDEFASIPEEIFNVVIQGFAIVADSPVEKVKEQSLIYDLKKAGLWTEELDGEYKNKNKGNQIIYSGTAYYAFNHFYKYFSKWREIISSNGDPSKLNSIIDANDPLSDGFNWKDYCIIRIPYTALPKGFLDQGILAQAKATLNTNQFLCEYGGVFAKDSDGFYKRSIIDAATTTKSIKVPSGKLVQFSASKIGDPKKRYVMGIDPAAERDNAAIVILEDNEEYRSIVHCWTTNRKKFTSLKNKAKDSNQDITDDYYRFIAKKIRQLMRDFNVDRICMDKNGGGIAIAEALSSRDTFLTDEFPVFEIINPDVPKQCDIEEGLHLLELVIPTTNLNSEANHGMLKDIQDKILLFPRFDTVELEKSIVLDGMNEDIFSSFEELVNEVEELKNELSSIVMTGTSILGAEKFDTPEVKMEGAKKGRLKKDRYSALLYANYYTRNKNKQEPSLSMSYKVVGNNKISTTKNNNNNNMYTGFGVAKFGQSDWAKKGSPGFYKRSE